MKEKIEINNLLSFDELKIFQNNDYFKFSLDSVLLPNFIRFTKNVNNILDLCTGNAPIPLILSRKTNAKIYGVEIQKEVYDLACKSVKENNLEDRIEIINDDINNIFNRFESDTFDIITCNPPYFETVETSIKNDNDIKTIARHEVLMKLEDIFKISRKLLKNNGELYLIHRTNRLVDIMCLMRQYNIEPKRIRFVYPKEDTTSNLMLIVGSKNGGKELEFMPPLYIHDNEGYTKEVLDMFS